MLNQEQTVFKQEYKNLATVSESITVAATDNMMLCGPVSFTATVTVNGTLTVV